MKRFILVISLVSASLALAAQENGYVTGSFETNNHLYVDDQVNDFVSDEDRIGSNNYLKVDYYNGNFSAGMQLESYLPAQIGFPEELSKYALSNLYVNWKDDAFQVTAGTFYDQFGSGLLFRSWEDRLLGLNNALMGARFAYNWEDKVAFKAIWGMPRLGMEFTDTQVRGADLSISLSNIIGLDDILLSVEGSLLNKYAKIGIDAEEAGGKPNSLGFSGRLNFDWNGFFAKGEYVDLGKKLVALETKHGNAQLLELGYNGRGLGVTMTGRRLEWMGQNILANSTSSANLMSYVPAMSTQYTYMLTTLHPYNPQVGDASTMAFNSGEIGGQIDAFYNFRRGTAIGGKRGMKVHANFSTYYTLAQEGTAQAGNLLFRDFSFDVERQWTKEFKMVLLYSLQEYNPGYGQYKTTWLSNIFVADLLYKWTSQLSTRLELQYLKTYEDKKDWMAALLEVNFAPHWSVWGSDMYNHGMTKKHYYNFGVSYAKGRTRVALGYGRYKDGFICSGGVCRSIPQYTGANFTVTTSF
ncbi:MAG: hypothetical protein IJN52_00480 [Bacteroidales bacterium]|mgnify:CR=1 FL=1|nr:hypothetical protein [Bacteroidales bacterium]